MCVESGPTAPPVAVVGRLLEQEGALALGRRAVVDGHAEEPGRQVGQSVLVDGRVEQVGGHRGVHDQAGDVDAQGQQGAHQLLDVVGHHPDPVGPEPGGQGGEDAGLGHQVAAGWGPR